LTLALEFRPNPSAWSQLLDIALPAIDYAFPPKTGDVQPKWTLGGGTAIALRIGHRISDDIDIFVSGIALKVFTPQRNPAARSISLQYEWPGHYLKFQRPEGEIDFLSSPLLTEPGYTLERFRDRTIALETNGEVIIKKIRYRSATFTDRDVFDLAAAARAEPALSNLLAKEVADVLPRLRTVIQAKLQTYPATIRKNIRPTAAFLPLIETAASEALMLIDAAIALPPANQTRNPPSSRPPTTKNSGIGD
jgi:Nucleotidyl transferase AbiEii toxin, Type IV TA system